MVAEAEIRREAARRGTGGRTAARKLKRTGVDLLPVRLPLKTLHPFMAAELGPRFDLRTSLRLGMDAPPAAISALDQSRYYRKIVWTIPR